MSRQVKAFCPVLNGRVKQWIQSRTKLARIALFGRFRLCSPMFTRSGAASIPSPCRGKGPPAAGSLYAVPTVVDEALPATGPVSGAALTKWTISGTERGRIAETALFPLCSRYILWAARLCLLEINRIGDRAVPRQVAALTALCQAGTALIARLLREISPTRLDRRGRCHYRPGIRTGGILPSGVKSYCGVSPMARRCELTG